MNTYYTGDRSRLLQPGMRFDLKPTPSQLSQCVQVSGVCSLQEMSMYFNSNFPAGVSQHGIQYLLNNDNYLQDASGNFLPYTNLSSSLEVIYEFVRQLKFPELPSRFQCAFAFEASSYARSFFQDSTIPVYEISGSGRIFKGDMTLLKIGPNHLSTLVLAEKYWSGTVINPSAVEVLIECPAEIGNRVL
ncbi:DUF2441 domain-containing protein [Pantoea eucrina]|uniref:DUF2441 domain-containing protein n=1 Tax=Pantoea eucrina TaxID=472693 RepID=UPI00301C5D53